MSRDSQRLSDYLGHILEAIERIVRYTEDMDEVQFLQSEMVQDAVIRNLEIIGKPATTSKTTSPSTRRLIQSCPWLLPIRCATR